MVYNIEELREACNAGEHFKFLFFWGHTPAADGHINEACLSQWWKCSFKVDEVEYSCAEQFMMAEKAMDDPYGKPLEQEYESFLASFRR